MIEAIVKDYLETKIKDVEVYFEQPETIPTEYILIEKIDGGQVGKIDKATLRITTYSDSMYNSAVFEETVRDVMLDIISEEEISSVTIGGESGRIDTSNLKYEHEAIYNFSYYN